MTSSIHHMSSSLWFPNHGLHSQIYRHDEQLCMLRLSYQCTKGVVFYTVYSRSSEHQTKYMIKGNLFLVQRPTAFFSLISRSSTVHADPRPYKYRDTMYSPCSTRRGGSNPEKSCGEENYRSSKTSITSYSTFLLGLRGNGKWSERSQAWTEKKRTFFQANWYSTRTVNGLEWEWQIEIDYQDGCYASIELI